MKNPRKNRFSPAEARKSKREAIIIAISLFFIVVLTLAELRLSDISSTVPGIANIFIFGLINVVLLLIILLVYLVFRNVARIILERRRNPFGSRLRGKLVVAFVALSFIPTILLFIVSASFINMSIKNWLDRQVEQTLAGSLDIANAYYREAADSALHFARLTSDVLSRRGSMEGGGANGLGDYLGGIRREYNLGVVEVYSSRKELLARSVHQDVPIGVYPAPSPRDISLSLEGREFTRVESVGKADLIRAITPIVSQGDKRNVLGAVAVGYYVQDTLVGKAKYLSGAYDKYRQLKLLKSPIRGGYILTLFLITLVIIFLAVWFGVYLANSLTTPLRDLSLATQQVAEGNLDVQLEGEGDDEIGMLVDSFNRMTEDLRSHRSALSDANQELTRRNQELDQRRRYMEFVLGNVTAGVISVNREGVLTTINPSAERLLSISSKDVIGRRFQEILRPNQQEITRELLRELADSGKDTISRQVDVRVREGKKTLSVNLSVMRDENGHFIGTVAVFDDLTRILKIQRMEAWREVARRIAHEIKNPLTPIKLSAQRLRRKYLSRFTEDERAFDECTGMIIKSVDELKVLVDEFSSFARMPAAHPAPDSLNEVIVEAVTLYQESHRQVDFSFSPDETLPLILIDRDQIKRVLINLLDNAVDAIGGKGGSISIETSYNPELRMATFSVADTGHGILPEDKPRLFEPYFSTKKAGTGLGLAIVNTIITDHRGFIRIRDNEPEGTKFIIELPAGA